MDDSCSSFMVLETCCELFGGKRLCDLEMRPSANTGLCTTETLVLEEADGTNFNMLLAGALQCWELLDVNDRELTTVLSIEEEAWLVPAAVLDLGEDGKKYILQIGNTNTVTVWINYVNGREIFLRVAKLPSGQTRVQNKPVSQTNIIRDSLNIKEICCSFSATTFQNKNDVTAQQVKSNSICW